MKYSSKTIQLLIRLRDGEQVNSGEFSSAQRRMSSHICWRTGLLVFSVLVGAGDYTKF